MIALAIGFLVIALLAAYLGFRGGANTPWEGGRLLAVVFGILAVATFLGGSAN
jgi:uncharacterized membrane protein YtjA (UPF0391 family)